MSNRNILRVSANDNAIQNVICHLFYFRESCNSSEAGVGGGLTIKRVGVRCHELGTPTSFQT